MYGWGPIRKDIEQGEIRPSMTLLTTFVCTQEQEVLVLWRSLGAYSNSLIKESVRLLIRLQSIWKSEGTSLSKTEFFTLLWVIVRYSATSRRKLSIILWSFSFTWKCGNWSRSLQHLWHLNRILVHWMDTLVGATWLFDSSWKQRWRLGCGENQIFVAFECRAFHDKTHTTQTANGLFWRQ